MKVDKIDYLRRVWYDLCQSDFSDFRSREEIIYTNMKIGEYDYGYTIKFVIDVIKYLYREEIDFFFAGNIVVLPEIEKFKRLPKLKRYLFREDE